MTELIHNLFYMVDEWADRQSSNDPKLKELSARQSVLRDEIILRLGDGGRDMIEDLSNLSLKLETIHDEALFRAAMQPGSKIAGPELELFHVKHWFYSTFR